MRPFHRLFLLILLMSCATATVRAQEIVTGRIVDADSKEPLPFVHVYISEGRGAVTNYEGVFKVSAHADETVKITHIGYTSLYYKVANLPETIMMKALTTQMREVTVFPIQSLLVRASKKLYAEQKRFKNEQSTFFLRMREDYYLDSATWAGHKAQMTEAFLRGYSAVNLRSPVAVTGYRSGWTPEQLAGSGYQWLQMGVMMQGDEIHMVNRDIITPLHRKASRRYYERNYHITYSAFTDEDGQELLRIVFRRWDDVKKPIITGTLILNSTTLEPLSFDGAVCNALFLVNVDEYKALERVWPRIHIDYTQKRGFTEVADLYARNVMSKMDQRYTMVNVGSIELPSGVLVDKNNLWTAIDSAGFDEDFWTRHETVARTADEQALFNLKRNADEEVFQLQSFKLVPDDKKDAADKERRRRDSIAMSRIRGVLIIDSLTRKAVPFAQISVSGKVRTMSNLQGFFNADFHADDTLTISANGYETRRLPASQLQRIVRLVAMEKETPNPRIQIDELLAAVGNKLIVERQAHTKERAPYFFRRVRFVGRDSLMTEAILDATSALQITDPKVVKGHHYATIRNDSITEDDIFNMNPLRSDSMLMEIIDGSSTGNIKMQQQVRDAVNRSYKKMAKKQGDFKKPFVPLLGTGRTRHYRRHYDLRLENLRDSQGHSYARIIFSKKPNWRYPVIVGNLLIDIDSLRILSFDGYLDGRVSVNSKTRKDHDMATVRPSVSIHYDFRHDHGFTEVWHAGFHTVARDISFRSYTEEWYVLMNCSGMPAVEDKELEGCILRMYDEEQLTRYPHLPMGQLVPPLITFDIFSETADWRLLM